MPEPQGIGYAGIAGTEHVRESEERMDIRKVNNG